MFRSGKVKQKRFWFELVSVQLVLNEIREIARAFVYIVCQIGRIGGGGVGGYFGSCACVQKRRQSGGVQGTTSIFIAVNCTCTVEHVFGTVRSVGDALFGTKRTNEMFSSIIYTLFFCLHVAQNL